MSGLLSGWTPFRAGWIDGEMTVDWCHLGARRFTDPFFYETISMAIGQPFNAAFRQRTRADDLGQLSVGLRPSGFIFHMARCGSTLCAQVLAADPAHVVMSEPMPVRSILEAPHVGPVAPVGPVTQERAARWLAGILNALARPRFPEEARFFVKFMAADVLDFALIGRVFPDVPWLFLYRDPLEILASQMRLGGADTLRGTIAPGRLGLDAAEIGAMPAAIHQLHLIAAFGRAALDGLAARPGRGLVLRYDDLPGALWERIPSHFGFVPTQAGRAAMEAAAARNAKAPGLAFTPDGAAKRREAAAWTGAGAEIAGPVIAALDAHRSAG